MRSLANHNQVIIDCAQDYNLDPNLIRAVILTESAGQSWATRYEPGFKYTLNVESYSAILGITQITETTHQKTSWGLMQVMGCVARELGFKDHLPMLCLPYWGITIGCKKLGELSRRYQREEDVVASYNAGSVIKTKSGVYVNERYVDTVYKYLREFRKLK